MDPGSACVPSVEITPHIGLLPIRPSGQTASRGPQTFSRFALFSPRRALRGAVCTIRGRDLARRAVPVLLMPAVGLTLSLPQRIGTLSDLLVLLRIHGQYPPQFLRLRLTLPSAATKLPLVCSRRRACPLRASARRRTNRLLRGSRHVLPHGLRGPQVRIPLPLALSQPRTGPTASGDKNVCQIIGWHTPTSIRIFSSGSTEGRPVWL